MEEHRKSVKQQLEKIYINISSKIEESIYNYSNEVANNSNLEYLVEDIYNNKIDNILPLLLNNEFLKENIRKMK